MPKLHPISCLELSHRTSGGFRNTTNNRMEIFAAIAGLEMLKQPGQVTGFAHYRTLHVLSAEGKVTP